MGTVAAGFSMSLDGFIAGPNDDTGRVFAWMFSGDTDLKVSIGYRANRTGTDRCDRVSRRDQPYVPRGKETMKGR